MLRAVLGRHTAQSSAILQSAIQRHALSVYGRTTPIFVLKFAEISTSGPLLKKLPMKNGYSGFPHPKKRKATKLTYAYAIFLAGSLMLFWCADLPSIVKKYFPSVRAASPHDAVEGADEEEEDEDKKKKKRIGFRDRKIISYENRIRSYSTPDKIFRYFAVLQVKNHETNEWEVFMTPDDFVRSITPGIKQPEGLGLDQFKKFNPKKDKFESKLGEDSIFSKLGQHGLISFSDYIFLLVILSTPKRMFELAFRMFDTNGDGNVDYEEFSKVQAIIRSQTSIGMRHRDHSTTGNTIKPFNSALSTYFFGPKLNKKLTIDQFLKFQSQLQTDVLRLEFQRAPQNEKGLISEVGFASSIISYAGFSDVKCTKMIKRVRKKYKGDSKGVSFDEYFNFYMFLRHVNDVDTALTFYHVSGASIDQATLKHVVKIVTGIQLSDHLLDIVFTLFDENNDGQLSNKEFIAVMKHRLMRGLEKPKDTGLWKIFSGIGKSFKKMIWNVLPERSN